MNKRDDARRQHELLGELLDRLDAEYGPPDEALVEEFAALLAGEAGPRSRQPPPGAGAFRSGRRDVAERAEEILAETGFGESRSGAE